MRPYLSSYVKTLSRQRSERISTLLEEARVGKEQLDELAKRLEQTVADFNPAVLRKDQADKRILSQNVQMNLREIGLRISDLYRVSNLISLLLESHASVLSSDIGAIEEELVAMDKMATNFAFLLSDNQAYDFAHLEPFNDTRGKDEDLLAIPDRSNSNFSAQDQASVRNNEGVLVLPQPFRLGHGLSARIVKSNIQAHKLFETPLVHALKHTQNGWALEAATPRPVSSHLPESGGRKGAQVLLEFELNDPAPASEVQLIPQSKIPMEIIQVSMYSGDSENTKEDLLDQPRVFGSSMTLSFPMKPVKKFRVLLNQDTYVRQDRQEKPVEMEYRKKMRRAIERTQSEEAFHRRSFHIRRLERTLQTKVNGSVASISLPSTDLSPNRGGVSRDKIMRIIGYGETGGWNAPNSHYAEYVYDITNKTGGKIQEIERNKSQELDRIASSFTGSETTSQTVPIRSKKQESNPYRYSFGLAYVGLGVEEPRFNGVFVSKKLPASGDIGEVRIKAGVEDYILPVSERASRQLTSVEFSVSNSANPIQEDDWIPILPMGQDSVEGERLFLDENNNAFLRFEASRSQTFRLYRNGYTMNNFTFLKGRPGNARGVRVDSGVVSPDDVITCDYYPANDETIVNFESHGFEEKPLVSAFDSSGAGERFLSTSSDRNTITLKHLPYIDSERATSSSTYSPTTVQLDSGEVAINLTDYKTGASQLFPADTESYYYVQSGRTLIFDKPIIAPFRVYYQYLKNNVRFRVVLRCNSIDFVSPKVDYVHLKAKTRRPDIVQGLS